ncbi:MAG: glycerol-3-phosphate responsive antiterminator [Lachnospiraceae bacterium]|nr:glycerol-3-phosphate responsive antiterminator [Lachnospiraceae bacterium]MBO7634028.1 glycerol-3-phosphate responsive antiterminator [Lachnospiraceae bacterium]MBP5653033.1 glycerol-3-phosphate responsive antiterminator [Lachnospiraceae bacterium]MBQ3911999.1 glycerol-3-phosphate responsive antiterminator [Lachnospiraceae bacterium]
MNYSLRNMVEECPVIAAIKDEAGLENCLDTDIGIVFVLFGDICSISDIVNTLKEHGKTAMVHIDLITGLGSKEIAVDYIKRMTSADGIISTKPMLIKRAKELGLFTIQRFFVLDSLALENISKQTDVHNTDLIEILPGVMPKIISRITGMINIPVIAGGLISDKEDVISALDAGAVAVSTTKREVWEL